MRLGRGSSLVEVARTRSTLVSANAHGQGNKVRAGMVAAMSGHRGEDGRSMASPSHGVGENALERRVAKLSSSTEPPVAVPSGEPMTVRVGQTGGAASCFDAVRGLACASSLRVLPEADLC